uniref:Uncharacterized protein n=1 Tax=Arundo donax TaxID=35708 RepID=A0A0A9ACS1_ARUDO
MFMVLLISHHTVQPKQIKHSRIFSCFYLLALNIITEAGMAIELVRISGNGLGPTRLDYRFDMYYEDCIFHIRPSPTPGFKMFFSKSNPSSPVEKWFNCKGSLSALGWALVTMFC